MSKRYHVNESGNVKPCAAQKHCPVGGEHFEQEADAKKFAEQRLLEEHGTFRTLVKQAKAQRKIRTEEEDVKSGVRALARVITQAKLEMDGKTDHQIDEDALDQFAADAWERQKAKRRAERDANRTKAEKNEEIRPEPKVRQIIDASNYNIDYDEDTDVITVELDADIYNSENEQLFLGQYEDEIVDRLKAGQSHEEVAQFINGEVTEHYLYSDLQEINEYHMDDLRNYLLHSDNIYQEYRFPESFDAFEDTEVKVKWRSDYRGIDEYAVKSFVETHELEVSSDDEDDEDQMDEYDLIAKMYEEGRDDEIESRFGSRAYRLLNG